MKIVCIADTHGRMEGKLPEGDVLIHAGDICAWSTLPELAILNNWLGTIKDRYKHIVFVPGNHDRMFETDPSLARNTLTNAHVLINEGIELEDMYLWGSPYTLEFRNWAFMKRRGFEMERVWKNIPDSTDILITHGPPYGILDVAPLRGHQGCEALRDRVKEIGPQVHVFGHIHEGYCSRKVVGATEYVNASVVDGAYEPTDKPIVVVEL